MTRKIKTLFLTFASGILACGAAEYTPVISSADMARSEFDENTLYINYTVDRAAWSVPTNSEVRVTPVIRFDGDSIELTPVIFAGRNAYLSHKRNHDVNKQTILERAKGNSFSHSETIAWQEKMEHSQLAFRSETYGCRCKEEGVAADAANFAFDFSPKHFDLIIPERDLRAMEQRPEEVVKTRAITRTAHVNYPVNKTVLLPDFRNNPIELAAILATIDSVRNDRDLTVTHVSIHGYASPEGSYELNKNLAEGRTESLRWFVDKHYGFGSMLTTASTPEDWAGMRHWVSLSQLSNKENILRIIDSALSADEKDRKIRADYPADYSILLEQVYPNLRRADYKIEYVVKNFTDIKTIDQALSSNPDKLSLEEMLMLARSYDEGSDRRQALLLEAAEIFPGDPRAQLNAAFAAMGRGDLPKAKELLEKSGDSPVATYARGVYYLYAGDKATAKTLLQTAAAAGVEGAAAALNTLK